MERAPFESQLSWLSRSLALSIDRGDLEAVSRTIARARLAVGTKHLCQSSRILLHLRRVSRNEAYPDQLRQDAQDTYVHLCKKYDFLWVHMG